MHAGTGRGVSVCVSVPNYKMFLFEYALIHFCDTLIHNGLQVGDNRGVQEFWVTKGSTVTSEWHRWTMSMGPRFKGSQLGAFCPYAIVYCHLEFKLRYLKQAEIVFN